jgi:hypothetical protein
MLSRRHEIRETIVGNFEAEVKDFPAEGPWSWKVERQS